MIGELKIQNFRSFANLELFNLKRVNLVVGENNAGKTSLLEAIFSACEPARIQILPGLFRVNQGNGYFRWLLRDGTRNGLLSVPGQGARWTVNLVSPDPGAAFLNDGHEWVYADEFVKIWADRKPNHTCRSVSVQYCDPQTLVNLVGKAQKRGGGEETVQDILASVDPRIKKVRVDPGEKGNNQVIVDIGLSELVPVTQLGQGIYRLLSLLADIVGEKPDVILIDEVENGLHHTVFKQVWSGLAEIAEKLNVQIFATTHSGECFEAAHDAFSGRKNYDLGVIQLFRVESGIQGRVLDREHIEAAIAGNIDVR